MLAVLGGLGAALCWATGTLAVARASRLASPQRVLAWVMLTGFVIVVPLDLAAGPPGHVDAHELGWLAVSGAGNVLGLLFTYAALRIGKASIISPITSTEGAIAAVLAVLFGEQLGAPTAALLALIVVGVVVASRGEDPTRADAHPGRASTLAAGAALCFGAGLYSTGRVSQSLPIVWALLPPRLLGVVAIAVPLALRRELSIVRAAVPLVVLSGICEVAGFTSYALGARHGIAVAAVLASQFAAFVVLGSFVVFHERLRVHQFAAITAIGLCVAALTAVRA